MEIKVGEQLQRKTQELLDMEREYAAVAFGAPPGFIISGQGSTLVDVEGKEILDFTCMMSATNLGHCHPRMVEAVTKSMQTVTLTNLSTHSSEWPVLAKTLCQRFGYEKATTMVSGAEAADSACKIAQKWAIRHKGVSPEDVMVLGCSDNYHGLSSGIWPIMNPGAQAEYGLSHKSKTNCHPRTGEPLRYGHVEDFEAVLGEIHHRVAAVILECIHGKLPTFEEEIQFAIGVRQLCRKYNILFIADEVRMGSAKTGRFLSSDWMGPENKPDMITLGKSITGGVYPASYILGSNEVMSLIGPFQVGSTFAMAHAANAATLAALRVYDEEKLTERAPLIEDKWKKVSSSWKHPFIQYATSRGADFGIILKADDGARARRIVRLAYQRGLLLFPQGSRIRLGVALTITDEELEKGLHILQTVLDDVDSYGDIPGSEP